MRRRAGPVCQDPGCTSRDLGKPASPPPHINSTKILREYKAWAELARLMTFGGGIPKINIEITGLPENFGSGIRD